jgi:tetratricopeptide (TPR) repeat protein
MNRKLFYSPTLLVVGAMPCIARSTHGVDPTIRCIAFAAAAVLFSAPSAFAYDERKYQALLESAKQHTKMMELEESMKDLTAAIKLNPTNHRTYQLRSEAERDLNLLPEAIADMTRSIALNPQEAGLYRDRGYLYFKNSQHKQAIADYTKSLSIDPKDAGAYRSRGRNLACLKQYRAAAADYKKALEFKSKTMLRSEIETRGILGELYIKSKQEKEALEQFNILISKFPHISKGFYGRAEVYKMQGKNDLAKKDLERAHELDYEIDPALRKMK